MATGQLDANINVTVKLPDPDNLILERTKPEVDRVIGC